MTGPLDGQTYTEVMIPMGSNKDEWIADVASYVRGSFGNSAGPITAAEVASVRAATANRRTSWTQPELEATVPVLIATDASWKATASHNTERAEYGLNFVAWSSAAPQEPGMWFQVELPSPVTLTELQFESTAGGRGGVPTGAFSTGGGGGGGGGRGQAGPPAIGFPRGFQVQVSMDGTRWSAPVAQGQGAGAMTTVTFRPVQAKFVRITQTAADPTPWSIQRLRLFAPGSAR
jgi:hypothetical protein